jgi:hypothetical protein
VRTTKKTSFGKVQASVSRPSGPRKRALWGPRAPPHTWTHPAGGRLERTGYPPDSWWGRRSVFVVCQLRGASRAWPQETMVCPLDCGRLPESSVWPPSRFPNNWAVLAD